MNGEAQNSTRPADAAWRAYEGDRHPMEDLWLYDIVHAARARDWKKEN